jgi:glycosyltransferase involved in cell wall biosynthesis
MPALAPLRPRIHTSLKLVIAIPALNEEDSIGSVIEQCLAARAALKEQTAVTSVEITVVSDGSTDRTVEIARSFGNDVHLIVFEQNRGYGAAIMEAWRQSDAELMSFLDADGTCDPLIFVPLCQRLVEGEAHLVLGCRMNKHSRMPFIRRVGNRMFAAMMSLFALTRVRDSASGMRVVRRTCLPSLLPLPTGLHFTPAMSARAVMSRDLRILEVDMPYSERSGESKLNAFKDGLRFLSVILQATLLYRPSRPMGLVASIFLLTALGMIYQPLMYWRQGEAELLDWMIYRLLVAQALAVLAVIIWCVTYLAQKAADISLSEDPVSDRYHGILGWVFSRRWFVVLPAAIAATGVAFVWDALLSFIDKGEVTAHWTRFVALIFFLTVAGTLTLTKLADYCMNLLADRIAWIRTPDDGRHEP